MFVHIPKKSSRRKARRSKPSVAGRARHLVDQVPYRITGLVHVSGQTAPAPEYESFLERDAIMLFAMCFDVSSILSQPDTISYLDVDGAPRRYTYDFLIDVLELGPVRIEVKPLRNLLSEHVLLGVLTLARHFISINQKFEVLTDDAIALEPRLSNVRCLRAFFRHLLTAGAHERISRLLSAGPRKIDELILEIGDPATWPDILALVARQELCIDWTVPLTKQTVVSLPDSPFPRLSYEQIVHSGRFRPLVAELVLGRRPTNRVLMAAALRQDRSVSLADPFAAVGGVPERALYVGREVDECIRAEDDERVASASSCSVLGQMRSQS